jgi:hypothetical protein
MARNLTIAGETMALQLAWINHKTLLQNAAKDGKDSKALKFQFCTDFY